jgi:histidyl-tRNA synthetase
LDAALIALARGAQGVTLTNVDAAALTGLTGAAAGVAAVAMFGAQSLLLLSDAVAALTLEALQGSLAPLDAGLNDQVRNLAGQSTSAVNIRIMLENSREIGKAGIAAAAAIKAGDATAAAVTQDRAAKEAPVQCAAQIHGSAYAMLPVAQRTIHTELATSLPRNAAMPLHAQAVALAATQAAEGLSVLLNASQARAEILARVFACTAPASATAAAPAAPTGATASAPASLCRGLQAALGFQATVDALISTLGAEMSLSEGVIDRREEAAAADAVAKEAKRAAAAAAREQAEAAKVAAMSSEERAKHEEAEAKKKAKRDKAAAAEAATPAPAAAGAVSNALGLGQGCAELRAFLKAHVASGTVESAVAALSPYFPSATTVCGPACASSGSHAARLASAGPRCDSTLRLALDRIGAGGAKRKAKIPKGTRDYMPEQMEVREAAFNTIRSVFKRHGAVEIDTPVFELRETLMGKYGDEGGKLVYDLADQGGELLSLRYDLTVPFARFLALSGIERIKRYHMARVYRRDNPAMNKGRYREFYQCDFDIAGTYAPMMPDAEVLSVASEILCSLPIGPFTIKLNHRGLLDAVLDICGVPASKFRPICSAIDKLDKEPWSAVREEMIVDKGLSPETADKIGVMVQLSGKPEELYARLMSDNVFGEHKGAAAALADLALLFKYMKAMCSLGSITFDLSLARGLDYYTGVIYEAVLLDPTVGVGSIAAGGRYDNLVGMFGASVVPCVGVSIGVERVFTIMEARAAAENGGLKRTPVNVLVASIPSARFDMNLERMAVCADLWAAGVSAEMVFAQDPKLQKQVTAAAESDVPFMVVLGEDELDKGEVQLKDMRARTAKMVPKGQALVKEVKAALVAAAAGGAPVQTKAAGEAEKAEGSTGISGAAAAVAAGLIVEEGKGRGYGRFSRPNIVI